MQEITDTNSRLDIPAEMDHLYDLHSRVHARMRYLRDTNGAVTHGSPQYQLLSAAANSTSALLNLLRIQQSVQESA